MRRLPAVLLAASLTAGAVVVSAAASAGKAPTTGTVRDGLLSFTPATVVDPLLFGGEPGFKFDPQNPNRSFVDWPVSSRQNIGVLYRSEDGGLSFQKRYMDPNDVTGTLGAACVGRQVPFCFAGGGGDTETNINPGNGILYMSSQEALVNQASATSFDKGDSFPLVNTDPLVARTASGVDRQWIASRKNTTDVYLAYHVPAVGEYIHKSTAAGAIGSWTSPPVPQVPGVTQSGSFLMDNSGGIHDGTLYVGYLGFPYVNSAGSGFLVAASTDGGQTFTSHNVPGGANARNFTVLQVDRRGNLYATWVDNTTQKTYLSTSKADAGTNRTRPASQWSKPVVVSSEALNVTIFSNLAAGDPGRLAVGYYGTTAKAKTPDDVKKGAGGWSPYVSLSTNALCQWDPKPCQAPLFHESVISHHINQDDNICTSGTACLATGGNRNLLDYFSISLDRNGHLGFVWSDTTNGIGMPFVKVARQASGPSLYKGKPDARAAERSNGAPDKAGDARYPIYGKAVRSAPRYKALDLLGTTVERVGNALRITVKVADTVAIGGKLPAAEIDGSTLLQQAKYVVRWDYKGQVYYAGANVPKTGEGAVPTFFSGAVTAENGGPGIVAAGGTPGSYYGVSYPAMRASKGKLTRSGFVIEVPLKDVGSPWRRAQLHSVGSYAMLGPLDGAVVLNTLPVVVDSTPTFDLRLR
jgi:hypothetical protein